MLQGGQGGARTCTRCGHTIAARGGLRPRYCAICGWRLGASGTGPGPTARAGRKKTPDAAVAALVLGICSIVVCAPLGVIAIPIGVSAGRQIDQSDGKLHGKTLATAGIILGAISVMMLFFGVLGVLA